MTRSRMAMALLSMAGLFEAIYLYLFKIGKIGTLACGSGSCETVQLSPQSRFLGIEVSLIGVVGYATMLVLSFLALQPRYAGRSGPSTLLFLGAGGALLFSAYLTGLELFVIHAICRWCVASAIIVLSLFLLAWFDRRKAPAPE
ncbi:MAG TPA: vitamin K epoxide reductase family protein [Gemmatimonadales bacterium]|nr:vitamin K epoxide reductase family protein [Gemmatimonadales bacterium]